MGAAGAAGALALWRVPSGWAATAPAVSSRVTLAALIDAAGPQASERARADYVATALARFDAVAEEWDASLREGADGVLWLLEAGTPGKGFSALGRSERAAIVAEHERQERPPVGFAFDSVGAFEAFLEDEASRARAAARADFGAQVDEAQAVRDEALDAAGLEPPDGLPGIGPLPDPATGWTPDFDQDDPPPPALDVSLEEFELSLTPAQRDEFALGESLALVAIANAPPPVPGGEPGPEPQP